MAAESDIVSEADRASARLLEGWLEREHPGTHWEVEIETDDVGPPTAAPESGER